MIIVARNFMGLTTASLQRGKTLLPNECPVYDTKLSDGEVPVILERRVYGVWKSFISRRTCYQCRNSNRWLAFESRLQPSNFWVLQPWLGNRLRRRKTLNSRPVKLHLKLTLCHILPVWRVGKHKHKHYVLPTYTQTDTLAQTRTYIHIHHAYMHWYWDACSYTHMHYCT